MNYARMRYDRIAYLITAFKKLRKISILTVDKYFTDFVHVFIRCSLLTSGGRNYVIDTSHVNNSATSASPN